MPEKDKAEKEREQRLPKAAVSTVDEPLVQADWEEAKRTRPEEFLPEPCVLNTNAAKEAQIHHKQRAPVSENDPEAGDGTDKAEEKDNFRKNAPETPNAPRQPKPSDRAGADQERERPSTGTGAGDRRSDNEVVRQEGLNAPREEAKRHETTR